jgi:hypothetical protein
MAGGAVIDPWAADSVYEGPTSGRGGARRWPAVAAAALVLGASGTLWVAIVAAVLAVV